MKKINPQKTDRILIRAANWVGDAIMSTPMLRAVRRNFPNAEIFILAKPWVAPVFEHSPDVDHILIYDKAGRHGGPWGIPRLCRELRRYRFDLAVLVQNAFEAALIAWLAGIPNRLGYDTDGRSPLLTHAVPMRPHLKKRHQIDYYLGILQGVSLPSFGREMTLAVPASERKGAEALLNRCGTTGADGIIGINPGAAFGSAKRWFPERYAELCIRLRKNRPGLPVVVFGGPGEEALGETICRKVGDGCVSLCGRTTLREAVALIDRCRLFVTNDSGLMHVAAALDIPQVAVFGPTNHTTTSPASRNAHMVWTPTPCSPCMKPECPLGHHRCMKAVTADLVCGVAEKILNHP
ncbi:lipopolysaccharide heptosyltransferase II [Desulfonema ishimotonii]|uniref:lipopolysaccharide heptosyltransferase II n=1 Tax=Desulfonema ishimotonii TaxID=45657 RepID=A0A401G3P7_9BACT|nr:lipopolysaccharide heptosyltransferase II [Desulfonema ishimotonii]GBC63823.1 lipopolysaccharide heptosyltransferase II [Desulfonema ishimotonii]